MNLFQDGDSLKWLSSPEESPTFVDWRRVTDFYMKRSAGVLMKIGNFAWSLEDPSSEHQIICETQDFKESHDTAVYVRKGVQSSFSGDPIIYVHCEQSGWHKQGSFTWFIDGYAVYGVYLSLHLRLNSRQGPVPRIISSFQGYYYCSVDSDNTSTPIFSPKVLIRYPGVHTFILHMRSKIPENSNCSDLVSLELPFVGEFNKYLQANYQVGSRLFFKKVNCSGSVISTYHHFYIFEDKGDEKELQHIFERSMSSGNDSLSESLERLNINKEDISIKSTVSCSKDMSHYNGHHLTWPETPIGQSTLPDEICITGRPRVTTPNEDRYLAVTAKRNRRSTASDLSRQLSSATGTTVSRQTVYRRLGHIGLYARRPVRCVPLTATHCRLRLTWSREHALWTPQQWSCVMFSDESRFSLQSDSRRTFIWRAPGTRYHQENTIERHRYGGAGWLVWGGIILGSRTDLHVQSVTMTGHIYRDVILEQHVRLFRGAMGAEFLFMDDNARPHRANIVDECVQSGDITRMDWPAYSPDLNPIGHVWDMLGRRIAARQPPPTCLPELRRALLDEWCNIPQDQIDNLILSMPRRCKACIASSGKHTPC
ncbi:Transposable element Tcb1 transposase [Araneus ventricosus]|uniref:Transposable element Tcb1 transposase n=1 Tax=Araneus ventricosus TaxID=182803 RepID=A0A4Y2ICB8_ARAVE|nr:Transposable element Tcb1 transposase [Araneus ventricosus]